ncbi:TonB-dependent receptor [Chitinophaga horti]|uniref:TonB-dependent receptor n=1 Tax=Chitinophaga horti TaxID=2920382 RepID=A0ABY6J1R6_9BACT|nr:TonB-dependent receptor [Chitinophaga horti]UYQ93508.1 TonB-dependent receptor [Chitinophaga horti]
MKKCYSTLLLFLLISVAAHAQQTIQGRVLDAQTREALPGVSVQAGATGCLTNAQGRFAIDVADSLKVTYVGYNTLKVPAGKASRDILLEPSSTKLNEIIISSNRAGQMRTEAPVAITTISKQMLNEAKATSLEQVLNKVSGVYMVDLGNEQHTMAIRQPIGYKSLFLYLEDGIPIRTVGDFNHNALIEINMAALKTIEVIRGPASSLYGSEAVGGAVNFITASPSQVPMAKAQVETSNWGYRRADVTASGTMGKFGILIGGYYAKQTNGYIDHSDFRKLSLTLKTDYQISDRTKWTNGITMVDYKTDQTGGLDSTHFFNNDFRSLHTFSYRLVKAFRWKSTLEHTWNGSNFTSFNAFFRNSEIGQNPFYAIRSTSNPLKARGEINSDEFKSYGMVLQHRKQFAWKKASLIAGLSADLSPATYHAKFIDVDKNAAGFFTGFTATDSTLTNYNVDLLNTAAYVQADAELFAGLKVVAALRYDRMDYDFDNHLPPSAFTGAPDEQNFFHAWTPKVGATYNFGNDRGVYANYSVGFAPPNISELYRGVKVPVLKPATYHNYEAGGWFSFARNKGYLDVSIYRMNGTNEIISVRLDDGSSENQNAGKTTHTGVELNLRYNLTKTLMLRIGGTYAEHKFVHFQEKGLVYDGNNMNGAPRVISNSELTYRPAFVKGLRIGAEWQYISRYYMDVANSEYYNGYHLFNARAGYTIGGFECWVNCRNVTDEVYAVTVDKSASGKSYRPGPKRTFNVGIGYTFTGKNEGK